MPTHTTQTSLDPYMELVGSISMWRTPSTTTLCQSISLRSWNDLEESAVVGGNGFAASIVQDLGFEPTLGATGEAKPKTAKTTMNVAITDALVGGSHDRRVVGEGVAGAGVAGAGVAGAGVAGAGKEEAWEENWWASHIDCP